LKLLCFVVGESISVEKDSNFELRSLLTPMANAFEVIVRSREVGTSTTQTHDGMKIGQQFSGGCKISKVDLQILKFGPTG
jgi:hypothetical protein